ncbi:MAG: hypothetical protein H7235_04190 [Bdellovibrionaceae bacterium]|nr:hypothetical protein [Pseudobdellovibrionaceae bacterium]
MKNYFTKSAVKPSQDDYMSCNQLMSAVDDLAPSDANVNAMIDRHADGTYHAFIAIQASCGKFFAEAKTTSLMTSLKQAQNKILSSLDTWKGTRFVS